MYNKKISVILPIYNVKPYVKQALDSLINQTFKDLEIICVDDCSTDGTIEILREYIQKDERIKLVELKENKGQGNARNIAIDMAQGKYVMFLDPDDWYELNACELAYNQITKNDNDFVMFGFKQYYEETGKTKVMTYWLEPFKSVLDQPKINLLDLDNDFIQNAFSVCRIYKKEFLDKYNIRYSNDRIDQDNIFIINAFISAKDISILNEPIYNYRINKKSTTFKTNLWKEMINARRKSYELVKERQVDSKYMEAFLTYTISALLYWYKQLSMMDKDAVKDFYDNIKEFFIQLKKEQNFDNIDNKLTERFKFFIKNDFDTYESNLRKKRFKKLTKNVFSIANCARQNKTIKHKVITVLGLKLKFKINQEKILRKQYNKIQNNYKNVLKRIKNKYKNGEKIRVVFLSDECQKWTYDSLYKKFEQSDFIEPLVVVFPLERVAKGKDVGTATLEENFNFYKDRNISVEYAYKNNEYVSIAEFEPDIVFYMQPWTPKCYSISTVSKLSLSMYCPYGFQGQEYKNDYKRDFHLFLYEYFVEHELQIERFETYVKESHKNCVALGYPKLDVYRDLQNKEIDLNKYWREPDKFKIIYAPHHSFTNGMHFATFLENGKFILELAKKYKNETTWLFKPHPKLEYALINENLMTENEVRQYYKEWEKIGAKYELGDYFDIFQSSDLMITDCGSFLVEYLPSKHPLIRPMRNEGMVMDNNLGKKLQGQYYETHNNNELEEVFKELVINKNDYKKEERLKLIPEIVDFNKSCADKIYEHIIKILNNKDNK